MRETGSSLLLCCWAGSVCLWPVLGLNWTGPPPLGPCLLFACCFYCFAVCTPNIADYTFFLHYLSFICELFLNSCIFFNTLITHAKNRIMHLISLFGVSKFYYIHFKFFELICIVQLVAWLLFHAFCSLVWLKHKTLLPCILLFSHCLVCLFILYMAFCYHLFFLL